MALFSLTNLIYEGQEYPYVTASKKIVSCRYKAFWESLGLVVKTSEENAEYYTVFSIYKLAESKYSKNFHISNKTVIILNLNGASQRNMGLL